MMNRLVARGFLDPLTRFELPVCEFCLVGKMTRKPFGDAMRAGTPLQLTIVFSFFLLWSHEHESRKWSCVDNYRCLRAFRFIYLILHKSEALDCFRRFISEIENQLDLRVETLRTERGRSIRLNYTWDSVSIRVLRDYWLVVSSPFELWTGSQPDLSHLRLWGCATISRIHTVS